MKKVSLLSFLAAFGISAVHAQMSLSVDFEKAKPISKELIGIFFEDISYSVDGGLYAELIQNRSFEYQPTEQPNWGPLSFWSLVQVGGGKGNMAVDSGIPVHPNNPHHLMLHVREPGKGVGVANPGFDGIPIKQGEIYDVSFFARVIYMEKRWHGPTDFENRPMPITVRLEGKDGKNLGETKFEFRGLEWKKLEGSITATGTDESARFVLLAHGKGALGLDEISLFPRKTFNNRKNGLRSDLAQAIADLHPKFIRFPGGCVAHGNGLQNIYHWKNTVGPVEQRKQMPNIWRYHQSMGLGYFEYFQFCEDIGATPIPIVAAGVSCQNSGGTAGQGQCAIPMEDMPAYIQDILDLIEWANGPATSKWGAVRAEAGHPAPFGLKYLGVGNEDKMTPAFKERFTMIYNALKKAHPEIIVIGTSGPSTSGEDYDKGWELARELKIPIVDEHSYETPSWFWNNLRRYDAYDRASSKVYLGEYAAKGNRLFNALAEAAALTSYERNGDIVALASYAPLLAKRGYTRWSPDLVFFTNTQVELTVNYWVQFLFGRNSGDVYLETTPFEGEKKDKFAASTVRDSETGDVILKIVNEGPGHTLDITFKNASQLSNEADLTILSGPDLNAANEGPDAKPVLPKTSKLQVGTTFTYDVPENSLSVIRIPSK
ncbi:MAG: alpha-L-arabinofuranosidase C-terminal domain-containing protein [Luteolibacter sp.]